MTHRTLRQLGTPAWLGLLAGIAIGQESRPTQDEGADLALEQLLKIEVTSVARREQRLVDAPAAVSVITARDLERSGHTTLAEALRLVPGMQVARIDSSRWAVTARGFPGEFANKLLVLMDGRSVYTPLFSGVHWDVQDTLLEDLERIEVIRGPGGALWGANAVNGVVSVISRRAAETQGGLAVGGTGSSEAGFGGARYGFQLADDVHARVYAKYFTRDGQVDQNGLSTNDGWDSLRGGFRVDWQAAAGLCTIQGDGWGGHSGHESVVPVSAPPFAASFEEHDDFAGADLLVRWQGTDQAGVGTTVQAWVDHNFRRVRTVLREYRESFDVDVQHCFAPLERNRVMVGAGWRLNVDDTDGSDLVSFTQANRTDQLFSAFVHDEIELVQGTLTLSVGCKLEHNDYTGLEWQPDARVLVTPAPRHRVWASVARAVRTPSRADDSIDAELSAMDAGGGLALVNVLRGNSSLEAEVLVAGEVGWRWQVADRASLDVSVFHHHYDRVAAIQTGTPFLEPLPVPRLVLPLTWVNGQEADADGLELSGSAGVGAGVTLSPSWTWFSLHLRDQAPGLVPTSQDAEGSSPRHQFGLRAAWDPTERWELDCSAAYVDNLPARGVPSYVRVDGRVGYKPNADLELSLVLQNLLDDRHPEFTPELYAQATEVQRGVYFKVLVRF